MYFIIFINHGKGTVHEHKTYSSGSMASLIRDVGNMISIGVISVLELYISQKRIINLLNVSRFYIKIRCFYVDV